MNGNCSDNGRNDEKLPENGGGGVMSFRYLISVVIPFAAGIGAIIFGCLKEPETITHWSILVMLVNRYPYYAVPFGIFLMIQAVKAHFRARK